MIYKKICVTGASGFLASHIIIKLLDQDYIVNAITRNKTKYHEEYMDYIKRNTTKSNLLTIFEYNDNSKLDVLINILSDCDCVMHCASPVILKDYDNNYDNEKNIIGPAIKYTNDIFNAISSTNVKRVILTSSTCSIYDGSKYEYNSSYWAKEELIKDAYSLSKIKTEKIAWKFYYENIVNKEINKQWDLIVLNPGRIIGPLIYPSIPDSFCSIYEIMEALDSNGLQQKDGVMENYYSSFCDVRDVAHLHIYAINNLNVGRYIISFEIKNLKDYYNIICDNDFKKTIQFVENNNKFHYINSFQDYKYISFNKSLTDTLSTIKMLKC
jgi:nucleoside-diphosphate-sugar epimerase